MPKRTRSKTTYKRKITKKSTTATPSPIPPSSPSISFDESCCSSAASSFCTDDVGVIIAPELNQIRRIIHGTFHQASEIFSFNSRGNQCTANAAVALAVFHIQSAVELWDAEVIDRILVIGDEHYSKSMATRPPPSPSNRGYAHHLTVTELHRDISIGNRPLIIQVREEASVDGHLTTDVDDSCPNLLIGIGRFFMAHTFMAGGGGIITCNNLSVAIFKQGDIFYYFDSHSRDEFGFCGGEGKACLISFDSILQMHSVILKNLFVSSDANDNYVNIYSITPVQLVDVMLPPPALPLASSSSSPTVPITRANRKKSLKSPAPSPLSSTPGRITRAQTRRLSSSSSSSTTTTQESRLDYSETRNRQCSTTINYFKIAATTAVIENNLGTMCVTCKFCKAYFFQDETIKCCRNGLVKLPVNLVKDYPVLLFRLLTDKHPLSSHFKSNIMRYNNMFAFASIGANVSVPAGYGPSMYLITGLIYHKISDIDLSNRHPKYGQLYFLDSADANNHRRDNYDAARTTLDSGLIAEIDLLLRNCNPFAKLYLHLKEVELNEREKMAREGSAFPDIQLKIHEENAIDRKRYNAPTTTTEVGVVFNGEDGDPPAPGELRLCLKSEPSSFKTIRRESPVSDPLCYPILFPTGELGWETNLLLNIARAPNSVRRRITMNEFVVYKALSVRRRFNPILSAAKLTQQFFVDSYVRIEGERLNYIRKNQTALRCHQYCGLIDYVRNAAERQDNRIGRVVILPSSFVGSPRAMQQHYQDAMTIVTKYGRPDLFITFTCNPKWREILDSVRPYEKVENRCDIVCRVFHQKFRILLADIWKRKIFGQPVAYVYSIEFQKRGLPHAHILLTLSNADKFREPAHIDAFISAEIPIVDGNNDTTLYDIVTRHMIHGPCGALNPTCVCMEDGKCTKHFPKAFSSETTVGSSYPKYRRRDTAHCVTIQRPFNRTFEIDNRFVVPYNAYLLKKFNAHINVEICTSVKSIKYIMKYIHKGHDCATLKLNVRSGESDYDETEDYVDSRYVGASEACWRLLNFNLHGTSHTVVRLPIHLPDQKIVYFSEHQEEIAIERSDRKKSMLEDWFALNARDAAANQFLYSEIPLHYRFDAASSKWIPRVRNVESEKYIARMYTVTPRYTELFHMRILLLHTKGARCYRDLQTVDGTVYDSFKEAVNAMHLIESDEEWFSCLREAAEKQMPSQMRKLLAYILSFCTVADPLALWDAFKEHLTEDFVRKNIARDVAERKALRIVGRVLASVGKAYAETNLPVLPQGGGDDDRDEEDEQNNATNREERDAARETSETSVAMLNTQQRIVYDRVMAAVSNDAEDSRLFFVDGPGGTGKTFVYNAILEELFSRGVSFAAVAWTGIAAILLRGGRTVHSKFRLPISLKSTSTSAIMADSAHGRKLRQVKLLIWDEITMANVIAFDVVDRLFKDLCNSEKPFGGKAVLVGGDFRQCLPVVIHGHRATIMEACVTNSRLWSEFRHLQLETNMRASSEELLFSRWLLDLGDGKLSAEPRDVLPADSVAIPAECVVADVVAAVYGTIEDYTEEDIYNFESRAILSPKNDSCNKINDSIIDRFPGEMTTYFSIDKIVTDDEQEQANFTMEFLNSITPSGLPNHLLKLKRNIPVMLLRNLDINEGLCNGTRLIVKNLTPNLIDAEIAVGHSKGKRVFIPRMDLSSTDTSVPFELRRRQFPLKVCFAMTINKAQGQTFDKVGIYLPTPVFGHGQLYVAFSRARSFASIRVQVTDTQHQGQLLLPAGDSRTFTRNVVYKNALTH